MNLRKADWYVDQWDPALLRWWDGNSWSDHYVPNVAYPQPDLPRFIPSGRRLGFEPKTQFSSAVIAPPGWYEHSGSIRWWDGVTWTELYYPKRFGVNLGGGNPTGYLIGFIVTLLIALPLLFATIEGFLSDSPLFGFVFGAVFLGDVFISFVLKANLNYMSNLRNSIFKYSLAFAEKLRGS